MFSHIKKIKIPLIMQKSSYIKLISIFLAELIGTALLLFLGCMGCIEGLTSELSSTLLRSINFGLVIMMMVNVSIFDNQ